MDLKFRRNLPLLLLFVALVAVLVFGLGNQPIIAYTFEDTNVSNSAQATESVLVVNAVESSGSSNAANSEVGTPAEGDIVSNAEAYPAPDDLTAVDATGASSAMIQPDQG